jgi:hypothetical protein
MVMAAAARRCLRRPINTSTDGGELSEQPSKIHSVDQMNNRGGGEGGGEAAPVRSTTATKPSEQPRAGEQSTCNRSLEPNPSQGISDLLGVGAEEPQLEPEQGRRRRENSDSKERGRARGRLSEQMAGLFYLGAPVD